MPNRRKPTAVRIAEGNRGKRALPKGEPVPRGPISAEPPSFLTDEQKVEWRHAVSQAVPGHLASLDAAVLVTFCVAVCAHRDASIKLAATGLLTKGPDGRVIASPLIKIIETAGNQLIRSASELGFTPASRSKVEVTPGASQPTNPFLRLVKG